MIRRLGTDSHLDVFGLDGRSMCRACGERPAVLLGRYCGRTCRANASFIARDPKPDELADRAAAIRETWDHRTEYLRTVAAYRLRAVLFRAVHHPKD